MVDEKMEESEEEEIQLQVGKKSHNNEVTLLRDALCYV